MNKFYSGSMSLLTVFLVGCSPTPVKKEMMATGGSRADGTVRLSYKYALGEKAEVDSSKTKQKAIKRCNAWGYKKAEPFDSSTERCEKYGQGILANSCMSTLVTVEYQCSN